MIYKWYCRIVDKLFDWLIKTDTIKVTPAYYVADDIVELAHAGFNNRFGDFDTETKLTDYFYDNNDLQQDSNNSVQNSTENESDL